MHVSIKLDVYSLKDIIPYTVELICMNIIVEWTIHFQERTHYYAAKVKTNCHIVDKNLIKSGTQNRDIAARKHYLFFHSLH